MSRRTIGEARRELERQLPYLTDYQRSQAEEVLRAAEARAERIASGRIGALVQQVGRMRATSLEGLTTCRDEADSIRRDLDAGRLTPQQATVALGDVRERRQIAEGGLAKAAELVDSIAELEADPVAYFDRIGAATPRLREDFPW